MTYELDSTYTETNAKSSPTFTFVKHLMSADNLYAQTSGASILKLSLGNLQTSHGAKFFFEDYKNDVDGTQESDGTVMKIRISRPNFVSSTVSNCRVLSGLQIQNE